jgi:hypothetical protein
MAERELDSVDMAMVARHHRRLRELAEETGDDQVQAIITLAAAVLLHGALEPAHLGGILRFVDPAVFAELANEHASLAEDIVCLRELRADDPASEDARLLSAAIRRRVVANLERDERVLYRPLRRLQGC